MFLCEILGSWAGLESLGTLALAGGYAGFSRLYLYGKSEFATPFALAGGTLALAGGYAGFSRLYLYGKSEFATPCMLAGGTLALAGFIFMANRSLPDHL